MHWEPINKLNLQLCLHFDHNMIHSKTMLFLANNFPGDEILVHH